MFARVDTRASGRYLLRADIAEFYRSVYTHSISWAIHSKAVAKARHRDKTLLGNRLDAAVQSAQYGQTNGIPIGPDTSLVLAEVVLGAVDETLQRLVGPLRGFRHHDDYELVFANTRAAEEAKAALQSVLLDYGLHLNALTTELVELPTRSVSDWWLYVRQFAFFTSGDVRAKAIEFFDQTFQRKAASRDEYVVAYAIGRVESEAWSAQAWHTVERLLHQALVAEPSAAHKFVRVFIRAKVEGWSVDQELMAQTIDRMLLEHAPYGHASEVAWMLWACLAFKIPLTPEASSAVARMSDSFVAILALDAARRGLAPDLDLGFWENLINEDSLNGETWLLTYEAGVRGWLPNTQALNYIATHPIFSFLKKREVRFYSQTRPASLQTLKKLKETDAAAYGHDDASPYLLHDDDNEDEDDSDVPF